MLIAYDGPAGKGSLDLEVDRLIVRGIGDPSDGSVVVENVKAEVIGCDLDVAHCRVQLGLGNIVMEHEPLVARPGKKWFDVERRDLPQ